MITLYDFMRITQRDYDICDNIVDASVTVCYIDITEEKDNYYKFCNGIIKKVHVIKQINDYTLVADWFELINRNFGKFKKFTSKHWKRDYESKTEFVYQWIEEINQYMAGNVAEDFYNILVEFIDTLE